MKKIFNLKNLAYFSILAMPLYLLKVSFLGVPTNVFEILMLLTIILFLKGAVASKNKFSGQKEHLVPIVMLIGGLLLSTLYSESYSVGLGIIKSWFIIPIVFAWVCAQVLNRKEILQAIYLSVFLAACVAAIYFFLGRITFDGRLQAFYNSPNYLAMYLAPAIIIGIFLWKENVKFYCASLLIIIFAFYLTQSYAAWLAVAVSILFLMIIKKETLNWRKMAMVFLIAGTFLFLQNGTDKLNNLISFTERSSASSRMMIWSSAWKIGWDNSVIGIGAGNFQVKYLEYQKYFPPYLEWAVPQPHNLFLAVWLQAGLLGLIGFVWLIFLLGKSFWQNKNPSKEDYICLGIILYILLHGLVDTTYFKNDLSAVFWLVFFSLPKVEPSEGVDV